MGHPLKLLSGLFLAVSLLLAAPIYAQQEHPEQHSALPAQEAKAWLGVSIQEMNEQAARSLGITEVGGVLVAQVASGGPADQAGLRVGDIIVEVNGEEVAGSDDFISRIRSAGVNKTVALEVNRGGATENINVQLARMPSSSGGMMGGRGMGEYGDCPGDGMHKGGMGMKDGNHKGMMSGSIYGKMMKTVKRLGLSPEQKAKAMDIYTAFRKQSIKTGAEVRIAHMELHELLRADVVSMDKVKAKVGEITSKKADLMMAGIKGIEDFKKVLTPEQRGAFKDILAMDSAMDEEAGPEGMAEGME